MKIKAIGVDRQNVIDDRNIYKVEVEIKGQKFSIAENSDGTISLQNCNINKILSIEPRACNHVIVKEIN